MLLTFTVCVIVRFLLVILAKYIDIAYLPILGYIALIPAIGFILIFLTDSRKSGLEVGNKAIWWNRFRPIHGILYLLFVIYAIKREQNSWMVLLLDVIIGILLFINKYYI
jgi:hypothetical protein